MADTGNESDEENDLLTRFKTSMGEEWAGEMMNALLLSEMQQKAGMEHIVQMHQ